MSRINPTTSIKITLRVLLISAYFFLIATSSARPPYVSALYPAAESASSQIEMIGADLDLTKGDNIDPNSLRLFVDNIDVTAQSVIRMTRDMPPSLASIFLQSPQLKPGAHSAEIQAGTEANEIIKYSWNFTVISP